MNEFARISELLSAFGRGLGYDDFAFGDDDAFAFDAGDDTIVNLCWRETPQTVVAWAVVSEAPADDAEAAGFCRRALEANFNGQGTEGLSLALLRHAAAPRGVFIVQDRREAAFFTDETQFANYVMAIVRTVRSLRRGDGGDDIALGQFAIIP